jgi:hypothetical protein
MKKKNIIPLLTLFILITISLQSNRSYVSADFQKGTIENPEEWFTSSSLVNFTEDYRINLFFTIANDSLGYAFAPRLSFNTYMNLPLNFTSYLNRNVEDGFSEFGLQIGSSRGNFTLGLNGTVIVVTPETGPVYINVTEGESETFANFETFIGENLSIPVNFNPITFSLSEISVPEYPEIESVGIKLTPYFLLKGTISLKAAVLGEELTWTNPDDIYFTEVPIGEDSTLFSTMISNISLELDEIELEFVGLDASIYYDIPIGRITHNLEIDFSTIEWEEGEQELGEVFIFLVDSLFVIDDFEVYVSIVKTPFSILSILAAVTLLAGIVFIRKRRNS